jgi:hypothetical protein
VTADFIVALESLGYTDRESAFLYQVAAHSGYFLRRQFDYFTDRNKGGLVVRFLEKARSFGHIESLEYKRGWYVYHLFSRSVYRLMGDADSQFRRRKGDAYIRARLMTLDYVLEHDADYYFNSVAERVHFFTYDRAIPSSIFTGDDGRLLPLLASFPIALADRTRPAHSLVRFVFVDEGLTTSDKFLRFLSDVEPLLRAVGNFDLVYVACSESSFAAAKRALWSRFSAAQPQSMRLFNTESRSVAAQPGVALQPRLTTVRLVYSYPVFRRGETQGSGSVHGGW